MPGRTKWRSGVLPSQNIEALVEKSVITFNYKHHCSPGIQPASLDLTLGSTAYRLQASFLPQAETVREGMEELIMYEVNLENGAVLEREAVYIIPLRESLALPANIRGKTNPKSSVGRLDVFTRVITDHANRFEEVAPAYKGQLYLEVVPRSFTIKVKSGQRLNQLRLFETARTDGDDQIMEPYRSSESIRGSELKELYHHEQLLFDSDGNLIDDHAKHLAGDGLLMSVDLTTRTGEPIGYKAKKNSHVIDLDKLAFYDAIDFWEPLYQPKTGRLILEPEEFYILASKEFIRVPLDYASEMVEFDAGSGELRTHYAGFFDPGFGYGYSGEIKGTKAVLEVRPHDVPFIIEDDQILFKMKYEKMAAKPDIWYGQEIGSNYHNQALRLSKQFRQD